MTSKLSIKQDSHLKVVVVGDKLSTNPKYPPKKSSNFGKTVSHLILEWDVSLPSFFFGGSRPGCVSQHPWRPRSLSLWPWSRRRFTWRCLEIRRGTQQKLLRKSISKSIGSSCFINYSNMMGIEIQKGSSIFHWFINFS